MFKKLMLVLCLLALITGTAWGAGITVSNRTATIIGNKWIVFFDVAFDSSYPAGGEVLSGTSVGLNSVDYVSIQPFGVGVSAVSNTTGYVFSYDYTNKKIQAFSGATLMEADEDPAYADMAGVTSVKVFMIGN